MFIYFLTHQRKFTINSVDIESSFVMDSLLGFQIIGHRNKEQESTYYFEFLCSGLNNLGLLLPELSTNDQTFFCILKILRWTFRVKFTTFRIIHIYSVEP